LRPRWPVFSLLLGTRAFAGAPEFTVEQILSAPFASGIVVAPNGRDFAWQAQCSSFPASPQFDRYIP
jgi:hypothetical protein